MIARILLPLPLAFAFALTSHVAQAGESVTVELRGGRSVTAEIDARTDGQLLWLRTSEDSIVFRRSILWEQIVRAVHAGRALSVDELRQSVDAWKSELPIAESQPKDQARVIRRPACEPALLCPPPLVSLSLDAQTCLWPQRCGAGPVRPDLAAECGRGPGCRAGNAGD